MNNYNNSLTVLVPALNEEKNIEQVITELMKVLDNAKIDWQLILTNDGSIDKTG